MAQQNAFINIPPNLDGIEEASEQILSPDDPIQQGVLSDIKEYMKKLRIKNEYFKELKQRPDESETIKRELAEKYENNPTRTGYIHYVIYDWKKP